MSTAAARQPAAAHATRQLPEGWPLVKLRDVCKIIAGQSPPGDTYRKTPKGLPFFQGKADFGQRHPVARTWCASPIKTARPGDILISVRAPVGPTNVADVKCCIGRGLAAIRCGQVADPGFVLAALQHYERELAARGSGSTFDAINVSDLGAFSFPLPPLPEQRRIVALLSERLGAVEKARAAAETNLKTARVLPAAFLCAVFSRPQAAEWPTQQLGEVADLLPARSIASDGDAEVRAITTACLSETGFLPSGVKPARMWEKDVAECTVRAGEILIARSNTPDLVGRACLFMGEPAGVVASDLTVRIAPRSGLIGAFLAAYLSFRYLVGYWKARSGGASGSMKKITRAQITSFRVPVPESQIQAAIASALDEQMATARTLVARTGEQLASIQAMSGALLSRAFCGGLR